MHIKEIILDGFKSYPNRTVVSGFDPAFNAITGLNGSGKSNILDSICFVLGITQLSQVRVGNLQELVYKQGQAGVTKATVSIVFDNSDPKSSPVGYEQHSEITVARQVVINGKNKFMINGHTAQQEQVKNLFHSVQLNVNNPHFLIMQGRITKVLNMNPMEILSMIEEAAGTRMFETKKQAALKTMERKQAKNDEIDRVLAEEITPTLEKLRLEKGNYLTYTANETKIERAERFLVANKYHVAVKSLEEEDSALNTMKEEVDGCLEKAQELTDLITAKNKEMDELRQKKGGEMSKLYNKAKSEEDKLSKELVKLTTIWKNKEESMEKDNQSLAGMNKSIDAGKAAIQAKEEEIAVMETQVKELKGVVTEKAEGLATAEKTYQNMCAGVTSEGDEESGTLTDQLSHANKVVSEAEEAGKQAEMTVKHMTATVKTLKAELKATSKDNDSLSAELKKTSQELEKMESKLSSGSFDPTDEKSLNNEKDSLESKISHLRQEVERMDAELAGRLAFEFKPPHKGFDLNKVKGVVARLVKVTEPSASTALEVIAGGKLYQVVVDNEVTAKALLQKGSLKRRVTILPLNKIKGGGVDQARGAAASKVAQKAGGTATRAIELVGFDDEVKSAMEYVFGNGIVCDCLDTARAVAYHPSVHKKCITLDGDVVDPEGTMTGGSSGSLGNCLRKLQQLGDANDELHACESRYSEVVSTLKKSEKAAASYQQLSDDVDLKREQVSLLKERLSRTTAAALAQKVEESEAQLKAAEQECIDSKNRGKAAKQRMKDLGSQEASLRKQRESRLANLEQGTKLAKKELAEAEKKLSGAEKKAKVLGMELVKLRDEVTSSEGSLAALIEELEHAKEVVEEHKEKAVEKRREYDTAKSQLEDLGAQISACDEEGKSLQKQKDAASKELTAVELEVKKVQGTIGRFYKEQEEAKKVVDDLKNKHAWIETESKYFGVVHTDYDFEARDPKTVESELKALNKTQSELNKKINKKVMNMLDKAETEYEELTSKRRMVEADKLKIEKVISELDIKKNQALQTTWVKVNQDFGSIFSTLLPGTQAKLEPAERSVLDGLEVKVAFGSVWKESLSELSGGQRSLLALSLILALLRFKPAPMYILDEVDAALDLSHTQNIGAMLRTHFSNSQFIVVSLKEGMFNNANVIFRTKFIDGSSTVSRTTNQAAVAVLKAQDKARAASIKNSEKSDDMSRKGPARKRGKAEEETGEENVSAN